MIAKVYYLVGVVHGDYVNEYEIIAMGTVHRVFDRDELPQAEREYNNLAKRNISNYESFSEAFLISINGEDKRILKGDPNKIENFV